MRRLSAVILAAATVLAAAVSARPQEATPNAVNPEKTTRATDAAPVPTSPAKLHTLDSADLEAFFDGMIPLQLERSDIAGATVFAMKDGQLLLQKGYGYADFKEKKAVDPNSTIFRLASISKLFTWTSVMQLQEQGKLDLDTDVNSYLDFKIRPAFGQPVTLRNLMTHTGGFEEVVREIIVIKPQKNPSLRQYLVENQPIRRFPPGVVPAYSNYGVGLASYIVERASGEPFEQYVSEHIFAPLRMAHSTFYQPPPKELETLPSQGYRGNTSKDPVGFEIFNPAGAGGISSTASDMGRFGQMILNGGTLEGERILKAETLATMLTPQFRASDKLPPICMGYYEDWRNALRWIGHEGDLIAFHSMFFVERNQKLILFVSFNSSGSAGKARPEIINMFTDRYFPRDHKQEFITETSEELKAIEGTYATARRADSTKLKLDALFSQRTANVDKDGVLCLEDVKDLRGHLIRWKPIAKDLFEEVDGQRRLFAIRDGSGKVIRLASDFAGSQSLRVPWYENAKFVMVLVCGSLAILASVVLATLSRAGRRLLFRNRPKPEPQPGTVWLPFTTKLTAWIWVALGAGILIFFSTVGDDIAPPTHAWDKYLALVNVIAGLAILLSVISFFFGVIAWFRSSLRTITKVKFSLAALACLFLSWFAIHWNVVGSIRL